MVLNKIQRGVFKVSIRGAEYCLKTIDCIRGRDRFLRELGVLRRIPSHPHLISLVGVRDAGGGKIDGMVLPYICGTTLLRMRTATELQKNKWKEQISTAISVLHDLGIVWEDVCPHNILIERNGGNAILTDFDGGRRIGWVDLKGVEGDLQGLGRVLEFIDSIKTECETSAHEESS